MTYLVIVAFVAILGSLAAALLFMLRRPNATQDAADPEGMAEASAERSRRMARALAFRVGFSILLFALILFSHWMGWIHPTGIPAGQ
jgi:hypothetical protein